MALTSKRRTEFELQNPELNYFIAFNIDPKVKDVSTIKEALRNKRNKFGGDQNPIIERLNELKEDIDQTLLYDSTFNEADGIYAPNSGGRKAEADRALEFFFREAVESAKNLCERGYIWDDEIKRIAERAGFPPEKIHDSIAGLFKQGVTYRTAADMKREIPFKTYEYIEQCLRTLNKKDLYAFLGFSENTPNDQLLAKGQELYSDARKRAKSSTQMATSSLAGGHIPLVFKSPASKREYDIYLHTKEQIWDKLSVFKDSGIKSINETLYVKFIDVLKQNAGLSSEDAEKELSAYLNYFGVAKESRTGESAIKIAQCPYPDCGKSYVFKAGIKTCPNCGRSLEIKCWNCGHVMTLTSLTIGCEKCGVSKKQQTEFDIAWKDFESTLQQPSFSEADCMKAVNGLENIFPKYADFESSFIFSKIAQAKQEIEKKRKEKEANDAIYDQFIKQLNVLIVKKEFIKASEVLKDLKIKAPTYNVQSFETTISQALKQAQQFVEAANKLLASKNESAAVDRCAKALEVCSDYSVAIQILKNYPPQAPQRLSAKGVRNTIKLDWEVDGDQNAVSYTIIRKIGSAPSSDEDGEVVESDLGINFYEDTSAISATAYYYGVFAVRGGVHSAVAVTQSPVTLFLDITNLHQEKTSESIKATWNKPEDVVEVEVYRKSGSVPPSGVGDGEKIKIDSNQCGFVDKDIKDDKNSYLIVCKYLFDGKECYSAGIRASYRKFRIPKPIKNVHIESCGASNEFTFTCDPPENGKIKLFLSDKKIEFPEDADDEINFSKKCKDLQELDAIVLADNKMRFTIPDESIAWLYPVISNEQLYLVNEPHLTNSIVGIDNLNVILKSGQVTIEGSLDPNVRNVIALMRQDRFAESLDEVGVEKRVCSYDAFQREHGFFIALKPSIYYITLFAEFMKGGKLIYSRGTKLSEPIDNRQKVSVQYALKYTVSVSNKFTVQADFFCDEEVTLPKIVIVSGHPKPLTKNNGIQIGVIDGGKMKKKLLKKGFYFSAKVEVDKASGIRDRLVLFFESGSHLLLKPLN